jgi:hypothetical protein
MARWKRRKDVPNDVSGLRGSRNLAILGLLLAFLAIFLAWSPSGSNLSNLYYRNGAFDTSPISNPSNQLVTLAYVLYPISLLVALWIVWTRRPSPWQAMIIAPAAIYMLYQAEEGLGMTAGPALTLVAGAVLLGAFIGEWRSPGRYDAPRYRDRSPSSYPRHGKFRLPRRVRAPLWTLFGIWLVMVISLYYGDLPYPQLWYLPDILSVVAGAWLGFRYFSWVANLGDRAMLFLVSFGSLVLAIMIAWIFILPYDQATSPFNQYWGIHYSASYVGLTQTLAAFGTPLTLFIGLAILYAGYKASRTIFVRYE